MTLAYRTRNRSKICCSVQAATALLLHLSRCKFFFSCGKGWLRAWLCFSLRQFSGSSGCSLIMTYPLTTTITTNLLLPLPPSSSPTSSPMANNFPTSIRLATCPNPRGCSCDICFRIHCPDCNANFRDEYVHHYQGLDATSRNSNDFNLVSPAPSCI